MKRGFTIIELLVASALLGMLVTILTMIFNQSSIAWRIGVAGVSNLRQVRTNLSITKDEVDNVIYLPDSQNRIYRTLGLWNENGELRSRAINAGSEAGVSIDRLSDSQVAQYVNGGTPVSPDVGSGTAGNNSFSTYMVNVKSGGPRNDINDYEAIWSSPDDTSEW